MELEDDLDETPPEPVEPGVERIELIGLLDYGWELVQVFGRPSDPMSLWLHRLRPAPDAPYGRVVRPLTDFPAYRPSIWTFDWSDDRKRALGELATALYRYWLTSDCPTQEYTILIR